MDNQQKILQLIKTGAGISAHHIIKTLDLNAAGVFRHLKKMAADGQIIKVGKPPKVLYHSLLATESQSKNKNTALQWAATGAPRFMEPKWLCPTRDVFEGRLPKLLNELKNILPADALYSLVAAVGEIGNNAFDHNLGNWRDQSGILFNVDAKKREIIIADRGQGVLATIRRIRPNITDAAEALKVAFSEIISGRAPEKRGNGLKYVKKIIGENNLLLDFRSGDARCEISGQNLKITAGTGNIPGVLAFIKF